MCRRCTPVILRPVKALASSARPLAHASGAYYNVMRRTDGKNQPQGKHIARS